MVSAQLQMFGFFRPCAARHLVHHLRSKNTPNGREDATKKVASMSICCMCEFWDLLLLFADMCERSVTERGPCFSLVNAKYSVAVTSAPPCCL